MAQSRAISLVEAIGNVVAGYGVAVGVQLLIFPVFGLAVSFGDNLKIGGIFTAVSILRSYLIRRLFNGLALRRRTVP